MDIRVEPNIDGILTVNGVVVDTPLRVGIRRGLLKIRGTKLGIKLGPFSSELIIDSNIENLIRYTTEGNGIGEIVRGPNGHPGDQDLDIWPVKKYQISYYFKSTALILFVDVVTKEGFQNNYEEKFESLTSTLEADIPVGEFTQFFDVSENKVKTLIDKMSQIK